MYGKFVLVYIALIAFNAEINELMEYVILSRIYGKVPIVTLKHSKGEQSYLNFSFCEEHKTGLRVTALKNIIQKKKVGITKFHGLRQGVEHFLPMQFQ